MHLYKRNSHLDMNAIHAIVNGLATLFPTVEIDLWKTHFPNLLQGNPHMAEKLDHDSVWPTMLALLLDNCCNIDCRGSSMQHHGL